MASSGGAPVLAFHCLSLFSPAFLRGSAAFSCAGRVPHVACSVHDENGVPVGSGDRPILGVARLKDPADKYLMTWSRVENNPVAFEGAAGAFPGQVGSKALRPSVSVQCVSTPAVFRPSARPPAHPPV